MITFYTLQIRARKCNYQLRVNDIITFIESEGFNVDFELPINHLTLFGANKIEVTLLPMRGEVQLSRAALFSVVVYSRENNEDREKRIKITDFTAPSFAPKDKEPPLTLINELAFVNHDPVFKDFKWNLNLIQKDKDEIYSQVVAFYRNFHALMVARNTNAILELLNERMRHYSTAMYMNTAEFTEMNKTFYEDMFANQDIIAWPLEKQKLILFSNYDSKLFTIKSQIQESPLLFYDQKLKESHYLDFFLGRYSNEKEFKIVL